MVTKWSDRPGIAVVAVNKDAFQPYPVVLPPEIAGSRVKMYTVKGNSIESYNDVNHKEVMIEKTNLGIFEEGMEIMLDAHSVNVIQIMQ